MSTWFYQRTESQLYTVGYEDNAGKWHSDSDHNSKKGAANRCIVLNGGTIPAQPEDTRPPIVIVDQGKATTTTHDDIIVIELDVVFDGDCPICGGDMLNEDATCTNCGLDWQLFRPSDEEIYQALAELEKERKS